MAEIYYLSVLDVVGLNTQVLATMEHRQGILRDEQLLASAIMRPQMAAYYEQADIFAQAATLLAGIALAHAFEDANKRTAAAAGLIFLDLNGYQQHAMGPGDDTFGQAVLALVEDARQRDTAMARIADWLRQHFTREP